MIACTAVCAEEQSRVVDRTPAAGRPQGWLPGYAASPSCQLLAGEFPAAGCWSRAVPWAALYRCEAPPEAPAQPIFILNSQILAGNLSQERLLRPCCTMGSAVSMRGFCRAR